MTASCVCGEIPGLAGGTVELAGVKHRTDGPCFRCDEYGNPVTSTLEDDVAQLIYTGVRSQWVMDSRTWLDLADLEPRPLAHQIVELVRGQLAKEIEQSLVVNGRDLIWMPDLDIPANLAWRDAKHDAAAIVRGGVS